MVNRLLTGLLCFWLIFPLKALSSDGRLKILCADIQLKLSTAGFENVKVIAGPDNSITIGYENRLYRDEITALHSVINSIDDDIFNVEQIFFIVKRVGVPLFGFTFQAQTVSDAQTVLKRLRFDEIPQEKIGLISGAGSNPSFKRIDVIINPKFSSNLGNRDDAFKYKLGIEVMARAALGRGLSLASSYLVPIVNEVAPFDNESARPYSLVINYLNKLQPQLLWNINIGYFAGERVGLSSQIGRFFQNGSLAVTARLDYTGFLLWENKTWFYSNPNRLTYSIGARYQFWRHGFTTSIFYEKYIAEDRGVRFSLGRYFNETHLSFFGIKTTGDEWAGFRLSLPILPNRRFKPARMRVTVPNNYRLTYNYVATDLGRLFEVENDLSFIRSQLNPNYFKFRSIYAQ